MEGLLDGLSGLPPLALYLSVAVVAAVENIFPPLPADSIVALGSFVAARGPGSPVGIWFATVIGNVGGAMIMYAVGRRVGAARIERRLLGPRGAAAEARLRSLYRNYGIAALVFSRFLPAVRAIVPPFAGALRVPPVRAALAIGVASAAWYGLVAYVGFSLGSLGAIREAIGAYSRWFALAAVVAASVAIASGGGVLWLRRRGARAGADQP